MDRRAWAGQRSGSDWTSVCGHRGAIAEAADGPFSRPEEGVDPPDTLPDLAVGETVILLHTPLHLVGVSIGMKRGRQQNDSLADGYL